MSVQRLLSDLSCFFLNFEQSFTKKTWTIQEWLNREIHSKMFFAWIGNNNIFCFSAGGVHEQRQVSLHGGFNTAKMEEALPWKLAQWPLVAITLSPFCFSLVAAASITFFTREGVPTFILGKMPSCWEVHLPASALSMNKTLWWFVGPRPWCAADKP